MCLLPERVQPPSRQFSWSHKMEPASLRRLILLFFVAMMIPLAAERGRSTLPIATPARAEASNRPRWAEPMLQPLSRDAGAAGKAAPTKALLAWIRLIADSPEPR